MNRKIECIEVGAIGTNCWLYALDEEIAGLQACVVIDPGEEASVIISHLQKLRLVPVFIFLTHGHFDHLAALPDLIEAFKKGTFGTNQLPKIGIHRLDAHYLGAAALSHHQESMTAAGGSPAYVNALWKPMPDADILFEEGDLAGPFRVLHLRGHTQGSVAFLDKDNNVLFSGDTLFRGNRGRTDLPGGNEAQILASISRLLAMDGQIVVCPGHGPPTTLAEESANPWLID